MAHFRNEKLQLLLERPMTTPEEAKMREKAIEELSDTFLEVAKVDFEVYFFFFLRVYCSRLLRKLCKNYIFVQKKKRFLISLFLLSFSSRSKR